MEGFFSKEDTRSFKAPGGHKMSCYSCGLFKGAQSPKMDPYGNFKKKIMVIGEAPGEKEDQNGKPFQGVTGRLLQHTLAKIGIDLFEDCVSLNAVNCRPPNNRAPDKNELNCCRDVKVLKAIEEYKPKMILLLGNEALKSLLGFRWTHSQLGGIMKWAGYNIPDQHFKCWICPAFHPSYVERADSPEVTVVWQNDLKRAFEVAEQPFPVHKEPTIHYIDDLEELRNLDVDTAAFDYEATGIKPHSEGHKIICASIAYDEDNVIAFMMPEDPEKQKPFIDWLKGPTWKIAQNLKYEDQWSFVRLGVSVKRWMQDTMIASHILDHRTGTTNLKFQAYVNFGIMWYEEEVSPYFKSRVKGDESSNAINKLEDLIRKPGGTKTLMKYCAYDSIYEYRLAQKQYPTLEAEFAEPYNLLHRGILAFARAERQGIRVDIPKAQEEYGKLTQLIDELTEKFMETKFAKFWKHTRGKTPLNIHSNDQLEHYLYKVKKYEPPKLSNSGKGAVDEEALRALGIPELNDLLRIRKLMKLRDTYLNAFITESVDGFIHPIFNLHTVSTYRSSSDSPNFQNVPVRDEEAKKIVRSCLKARVGHQILEVDFKGIEVGVAACYHKDPTMIKYIKDKYDMHGDMAKQIFFFDKIEKHASHKTLRGAAKNGFVFPQFYGDYYKNNAYSLSDWGKLPPDGKYRPEDGIELPSGIKLGEHLINNGIKKFDHFVEHLRAIEEHFWGVRFPVYAEWKKKWYRDYQKKGYFESLTGFRCYGVMEKNQVVNYPVQGSAFHCLLWTFIRVDEIARKEKWKSKLIGQVHDSIVIDIYPPEFDHVVRTVRHVAEVELLEHWDWINVPLTIEVEYSEVDESWYDKKELKLT